MKSVYAMWFSNAGLHVTASYESGWLVASYTGTSAVDMLLSISVQEWFEEELIIISKQVQNERLLKYASWEPTTHQL